MKKRNWILILMAITGLAITAAGCGTSKENAAEDEVVTMETSTPTPTVTPTPVPDEGELVEMEVSEDDNYENVIGTKTSSSRSVVITNGLDDRIAELYIRPVREDNYYDDWGDELIAGAFTLEVDEEVLYHYATEQDSDGELIGYYDICITFETADRNQYFFRNIPLPTINKITLLLSEDYRLPYAEYTTGSGRSYSTLEDVLYRSGYFTEETPTPTPTVEVTQEPTPTPTQSPVDNITNVPDQGATDAKNYIGQSIDTLIAEIGSANGSSYEEEPETGRTGYYYYDTFTVSTAFDDDGNEVVSGVW